MKEKTKRQIKKKPKQIEKRKLKHKEKKQVGKKRRKRGILSLNKNIQSKAAMVPTLSLCVEPDTHASFINICVSKWMSRV